LGQATANWGNSKQNSYEVVRRFGQATGVPVLLNTNFNVRSEPIVSTPAEAFDTFSNSDLDLVILDHYVIRK
jgi:carbamoyltransferase